MADINYTKSFEGSERLFAESFQGINYAHNAPIQIYLTGYSKAYEKSYSGIYIKQYSKEYLKNYEKDYEGFFNKVYIGDYTKHYSKQYQKTYLGVYSNQWTKTYLGLYEGTFEGTFNKAYEGSYNKTYEGQFTGNQRYNGEVFGQFEGTFNKNYTGLFARSGSPYIKTYTGTYTKTYTGIYEGQFTKQYAGTYEGTFNKTYIGQYQSTYSRQFTASWSGAVGTTRVSNQLYSGTYEKVWTHIYAGDYVKTYSRQFSKQYQGTYTKTYIGQYTQTYLGSYDKQYVGQYLQNYQKEYSRIFVKQYTKHYEALYIGVYQKEYTGQYTKSYLPNPGSYISQFQKSYRSVSGTFNVYHGTNFDGFVSGEPNVNQLFSGIGFADYTANYGEAYGAPTFTNYVAAFGMLTGAGQFATVNYIRGYGQGITSYTGGVSYIGPAPGYTMYEAVFIEPDPGYSPDVTVVQYSGPARDSYSASDAVTYIRNSYIRAGVTYSRNPTFYTRAYQGEGLTVGTSYRIGDIYPGVGLSLWAGIPPAYEAGNDQAVGYTGSDSVSYIGGQFAGALSYMNTYVAPGYQQVQEAGYGQGPYVFGPPSPFPDPEQPVENYWSGVAGNIYFAGHYQKNWLVGPYNRTYEGTFTKNFINERIVQWSHQYSKEYEGTFTKQYSRLWEGVYSTQYEGSYNKTYEGFFNKDYTGLFTKQYEGFFNKTYVGHYEKSYIAQYEGTRSSTSTFAGSYIGFFNGIQYTGNFDGPIYLGNYTKSYTGLYEGQFSKQYSGLYEGTFDKAYEGSFTRNYIKQWEGIYTKSYSGQYTNSFAYQTQYTGQYTKTYTGIYIKTYTGEYSRQFEGFFNKQYSALYEGAFNKNYDKQYSHVYQGAYTKTYLGIYTHIYQAGYIAQYSKEYEGSFTKQYIKTYGGAWSGEGTAYLGLSYFTNTYSGTRQFHQTFLGSTTEQSAASGNMTNNIRIKVDDVWKDVSRIRVKDNGQWKVVQTSRVKQPNGEWASVGIDHERIEINITSNTANFNLGDELISQGFSLYDKPKHVVVNIANNTFVYSTNTTPAFDTSLIAATQNTNHKVKILVGSGGGIIGKGGARGEALHSSVTPASSQNGQDGGDAILLRSAVSLFIESYGTIAGGGGGGGAGGILSDAYIEAIPLSYGGQGAGWHPSLGYVNESSSFRNGSASSLKYITHGGDGGLLGQLGIAAGGFNADDSSNNEANPGTNFAQYAGSGNGGLPGSAIKGYDASRVTFINSTESSVWGDSAFKFKA